MMKVFQGAEEGGLSEAACDWVRRDVDLWQRSSDYHYVCMAYI